MRPPALLVWVTFALFIASIPFEGIDVGIGAVSLSRFAGWIFFAFALLQPGVCFRKPPSAFWAFSAFLAVFALLGWLEGPAVMEDLRFRVVLIGQMLIVLWAASNLLRFEPVLLRTLYTFVASCVLLAAFQIVGLTSQVAAGRETALDQDPNTVGAVLSLGLVAAVGIAYGTDKGSRLWKAAVWVCFGVIGLGVVRTGSRGAFLSLSVGISMLVLRRGSAWIRVRNVLMVATGLAVLIGMVSLSDVARKRWELTLEKGSLAGRERILPTAAGMFLDRPILGWGFKKNDVELGRRLGEYPRDTHNLYLWVLTENGLVAGIPYFIGLGLCVQAAWRSRRLSFGLIPLALLSSLLLVNMSLTWQYRKLYWLFLGLALASARPLVLAKRQRPARAVRPAGARGPIGPRTGPAAGGRPA